MRHELRVENWLPTPLNKLLGCHWAVAHKRKRADKATIALEAKQQGLPLATGKRRVSLVLTLPKGQRRWDSDAFWKTMLDGLTACGLLVDDSPKWCELGPVEQVRGKVKRTVVVLEDC